MEELEIQYSQALAKPKRETISHNSLLEALAFKVTFHFVLFKIPSFAHVIGFSFIPNIHKIDNKVEERKRRQKKMKKTFC